MDKKEIKRLIDDISELDNRSGILVKRIKFGNLANAVVDHHDITLAVPILTDALKNNDKEIKRNAAWALTCHYAGIGDWDNVKKLMKYGDADVREAAIIAPAYYHISKADGRILALFEAAKNGIDIAPTVSSLVKVFEDKDEPTRLSAFQCLLEIVEEEHSLCLKGIKEATQEIRKIPDKQKRRKLISELSNLTQKIHDKMNLDKKSFPVKRQNIRKQPKARRAILAS
jgi:HEAT repeat protein